jgi:hypothetical protein
MLDTTAKKTQGFGGPRLYSVQLTTEQNLSPLNILEEASLKNLSNATKGGRAEYQEPQHA